MFTTRPELTGTHGMVASTHWLASSAGMAVLEDDGNAFDAAVAAGFVLQVVEPHLNGPGGEVPAVFVTAADRTPRVLCGQGVAPAGATAEHYTGLGLDLVPGSGLLAATIPGAWDGWLLLLRDHGTKRLADVLKYAIGYARSGFPLPTRVPAVIDAVRDLFTTHWPTSGEQWLGATGDWFSNPALADTWERLLAEATGPTREAEIDAARRAWSQGFVAEAVDEFARRPHLDDSGEVHAGVLTGADLAGWSASFEDAVTADVGGWTVAKCGPWSQGPSLLQQLRLLDGADLSYVDGVPTADTVHLALEASKLAFADREAWYGDSAEVPTATLLSSAYAAERRTLITDTASPDLRPGSPDGRTPVLPRYLSTPQASTTGDATEPRLPGTTGEPTVATGRPTDPAVSSTGTTRGDTVHIDVTDRWGNTISATPSGGWLQSSPTIPGLGFCLGSRAQMFWLEPGLPASLVPGRRPRTTLSPSLALNGEETIAFGTPGGDSQDQWQLCFWLAHTVGGLDLQAAIDAPAWHSTAFPSSFYPRNFTPNEAQVESRLGQSTLDQLARRGHELVDMGPWALGRLSAVANREGRLRAAANPRGMQGYAVGR
ncbi:gamma-glutamyltransferase family protein [Actinokineospora spheciospongiae]|uniref:gamma-glutamyltransferase family protein n=1 Tax=Actinokineospora spheciospongiae TaxID=909613 RepID=UPI000D718DCA|nr:gamma-glutamyltransferase [Actinokineospora spheciospongiae]PWW62011.1 gamma-glutamyltranspeptidase/glutathione hydrolase [Actinokineospora spheciospongiae]